MVDVLIDHQNVIDPQADAVVGGGFERVGLAVTCFNLPRPTNREGVGAHTVCWGTVGPVKIDRLICAEEEPVGEVNVVEVLAQQAVSVGPNRVVVVDGHGRRSGCQQNYIPGGVVDGEAKLLVALDAGVVEDWDGIVAADRFFPVIVVLVLIDASYDGDGKFWLSLLLLLAFLELLGTEGVPVTVAVLDSTTFF